MNFTVCTVNENKYIRTVVYITKINTYINYSNILNKFKKGICNT